MLSQFRSLNSDEAFFESANSRVHFGALTAHDYCNFCRLRNGCNCKKRARFLLPIQWSLVVTGLGFTSFFTRRFSCLQAAALRWSIPIYCFVQLNKCSFCNFLTVQKGKQNIQVSNSGHLVIPIITLYALNIRTYCNVLQCNFLIEWAVCKYVAEKILNIDKWLNRYWIWLLQLLFVAKLIQLQQRARFLLSI